jgi:hypothetical protein
MSRVPGQLQAGLARRWHRTCRLYRSLTGYQAPLTGLGSVTVTMWVQRCHPEIPMRPPLPCPGLAIGCAT